MLWPVWVTLALRRAERDSERRHVLTWLSIIGHSIRYDSTTIASRALDVLVLIAYLVPTIGPFFASTIPMSRMIGVTLGLSLCLTLLIERDAVTSVWCFFAAILSVQTVLALQEDRRVTAHGHSGIGPTPPLNT